MDEFVGSSHRLEGLRGMGAARSKWHRHVHAQRFDGLAPPGQDGTEPPAHPAEIDDQLKMKLELSCCCWARARPGTDFFDSVAPYSFIIVTSGCRLFE